MSTVRDQDPIEALASDGADESLSDGVCLWGPDRRADHTHALSVEDRVEGSRELAVVVADQTLERSLAVGERAHEVPRLLGRPCTVWVLGQAGEVHAPGSELDEEQHVDPPQRDGVDREEIARDDALCLAADELTPGDPAALSGGSNSGGLHELTDGRS